MAVTFILSITVSFSAFCEDFVEEFNGPQVSWQVQPPSQDVRVAIHQRRRGNDNRSDADGANSVEFIRIKTSRENTTIRLEHSVPAATVLDELEASVWMKSNRDGFALQVRIRLPEVLDPDTKNPRSLLIIGDRYTTPGRWQKLKCRTSERVVNDQMRLQRALKQISATPKLMYVDRVIVEGQLPSDSTDIQLDDLSLSPLVRFQPRERTASTEPIQRVSQASEDEISADPSDRIEFRLHRLQVERRRFFPRIVNYHKESPDVLSSAGINVVWVPDFEDTSVTAPLRRKGLWITATPPFAKGADGAPLDSEDASLLPFKSPASPVLFWMLGARMTLKGPPRLTSWTNQIRDADRAFKLPIAADVIEEERICSRHVDMLGISRHGIHSNCSITDYRDWMIQRRDQAWPDTFCWTWIQTEPVPALSEMARGLESRPMVEPEQLRLQVYAALAAGCRGIGFWTTTPLDDDSPAARERLLAITQLNLELDLFETWIASGGKPELVHFTVDSGRPDSAAAGGNQPMDAATKGRNAKPPTPKRPREMNAAMIGSDRGALLLPIWSEENSQFVPGSSSAKNVSMIIPGGGETASAWEITTTGRLKHLDRKLDAGGVQIKLPQFDQTAAILITSDQTMVEELNKKIVAIQDQSARVSVALAKMKLERIRQVDLSLQNLGAAKPDDARQWLGRAKLQLDKAEVALQTQQWSDARLLAGESLQDGRHLQRTHWEHAVRLLPSPTSSPWSVSFQSLPEHWQLIRRIERRGNLDALENLLLSGEFEDVGTMVAERWKHEQTMLDTVQSSAGLYAVAKQGKSSLRLAANPIEKNSIPSFLPTSPVSVVSPGVSANAGQYVRITGWAKIPMPLVGATDGAMIYDSLLGKTGAIRLKAVQDWKQFEFVRRVADSQDVTLTISLQGLGELFVDDVRISVFEFDAETPSAAPAKSKVDPAKFDLRRLNPLQKRGK